MLLKNEIIKEFDLRPFGNKDFLKSKKLPCPWCNRSDKFALKFDSKQGGGFNCFHGGCGKKGSIYSLLKEIGRQDLIGEKQYSTKLDVKLPELPQNNPVDEEKNYKSTLPIGFKEFTQIDDYLLNRGYSKHHQEIFKAGYSNISLKHQGYIIFQLFQKGELVGYIARSKKSKKWHEENLRQAKLGETELKLRYENESEADFSKIIGGYDDIGNATTLILVEGLFDKVGVDNKLSLFKQGKIRCCFEFGVNLSDYQINLLRETKIKRVILLYDYNTLKHLKKSSMKLSRYFDVKIAEITEDYDPGDIPFNKLQSVIKNLKEPFDFYKNRLDNLKFIS